MKKLSFFLMAMLMSIMSFAETYTHTFVKGEMKTGSVTLSDVTWNTAADPGTTAYNWDGQATAKGIQIGTKNAPCKSYTFSTSHFVDYMVTNITVNASIASSGTAKMQVSVGGVDYIAQTALTTTATNYTGSGASQGDVVISFTNTSKAFYIKSISITYQAVSAGEGMILVDQSNVDFGKMTKTKTIVVTGQNLTSVITTSLKEGANFTVAGNLTAEGGELTVNYIATEAGKHTDVLVLTSDDVTTEVALAGEVVVLEGAGTKENPYTVADVIALGLTDKTQAWVEGYIIGTMKDNALEETPSQYSNIVLAAAADVKENYVPVALASGTNPRAALNIIDNPTMLGAKVAVYGTLETYYSKPGVKNVSDYTILTQPVVNHTITVSANPAEAGTVTGGGEFEEGTEATLTATANEGYEFVKWTEGETVVSTEANYSFEVLADRNLVANFKKSVVTHDFYVENVTLTEGQWSIDLAGSWNEQAFILKLWQDSTQGFGTYAANAETGYAATLGVKELTPTAEGNFMQDPMNENAFIFQGTMTDGTDIYEVYLKGALASTGTGEMEAKDDVAFSCNAYGAWTIEAYADDVTWGLYLNVAQNPETMEWIAEGYYITNLEAGIMEEAEGTGLLYFDDFSGRQVFKGTLTTTSGEIYPTLYASSLNLMTNELMTGASWVGEFAGVDYYEVILMAADYSWELDLHARNCTGANGTYTIDVVDEEEGAYSTFMGSTIVTGELTIEDGSYEASLTTLDAEGVEAMSISLSAWKAEATEYNVVITNATVTENTSGYNIDLTGEWDGHDIKVEVCDELTAETILANFFIDGGIANDGDQAEGTVEATVNEGVVTITGTFECLGSGAVYNVTISGKLPVVEPTTITWELNGGELPTPAVPTNEELWIAFMPYYQEYYDVVRAEQPIASVAVFLSAGMGDDATIFTSEDSDYKWLGDYIIKVTTEQSAALTNLANWKFNAQAFFNAYQYTAWPKSADFTEAGKPENWGPAYQAANALVLPTEPVAEDYVLPTPVKEGYTFVGWYDNAAGEGEAMTVLPAGWAGTLYAIWKANGPTTALDNIAVEGKAVKAIINGQLIIIKNGVQYNAQGQVVK